MKNRNSDMDATATVNHRILIGRVDALVAAATKKILEFRAPHDMEFLAVDSDTSTTAGGTPTLDLQVAGVSALAASINLANNAQVAGVMHATRSRRLASKGQLVTLQAVTPAGVTATDVCAVLTYRNGGLRDGQGKP